LYYIACFLLLFLVGCQSIDDTSSMARAKVVNVTPGYDDMGGVPSYEVLSEIAASCDGKISSIYGARGSVAAGKKRAFSVSLGNASRACDKLKNLLQILKESSIYRDDYEKNLHFAESIIGNNGSSYDAVFDAKDFPEAGMQESPGTSSVDLMPPSHIKAEKLPTHPSASEMAK
jgi:hypothetical protein